jgi:uroporphyrinogen-III decarboxylase
MIELLGDLGSEASLFLSPALWRKIFKPGMKAVIDSAKGKNVKFFLHTDGNIQEIIPDLIEIGLNILNPIQPECMDPVGIKKSFGDGLTLHGSMSLQKTLSFGKPEDVEMEAKDRIEKCGYNGGLILAPSNALTQDIPVDNIIAFYDFVHNSKERVI